MRYSAAAGRKRATETAPKALCTIDVLYVKGLDGDPFPVPDPDPDPVPEVPEGRLAPDVWEPEVEESPKDVAHCDMYCTVTPCPLALIPDCKAP